MKRKFKWIIGINEFDGVNFQHSNNCNMTSNGMVMTLWHYTFVTLK